MGALVCHHKGEYFSWTRAAILPSEVQVICMGVIDVGGERHVWSCYNHKMQSKLDPDFIELDLNFKRMNGRISRTCCCANF